jgi:GT2 family glycosyltransferase
MVPSGASVACEGKMVSVIIPTKNRPAALQQCLQSLFQQTTLPRELIIVDQSSSEDSRERVTRQYETSAERVQAALHLCYIREPQIPGAAVARNRGMDVANGSIWLLLDDDMYLEPSFLEELLTVYQRHPDIAGVSGIITNYSPPSLSFRLWSSVFVRGPFHDERQPIYWSAERLQKVEPIPVSRFGAGLMSFRAEAVRQVRFDDALRGLPEGEDVDFCARLRPGTKLVIAPRARIAHEASSIGRSRDHWLRRYAQGLRYVYRRNWRRGLKNRVCFAWLIVGFALVATLASFRRCSLEPWRGLAAAIRA